MREKVIYTRWIANKLVEAGFPVVRVEANPNKPEFDCWVFEDSADFKLAYANIAHTKR